MKRLWAGILCFAILLAGCVKVQKEQTFDVDETTLVLTSKVETIEESDEFEEVEFASLDDKELLCYVENTVYTELVQTLDPEMFYVEEISTAYVSKEYLEEMNYNSQANLFFGYNLADLNELFYGTKYIFTLDDNGQTGVEELVEIEDDTYDQIIKNVAIGAGVILVCVTVAVITKNPAMTATAGKTVKIIFTASSMGAKAGTVMALQSAGIGGTAAAVAEGIRTGDPEKALEAGIVGASEGFKVGAIFGTVKGIADGIRVVGNSRFFPEGSTQALKYPEGVEFTKAADGNLYPRFEKWARATAKFDTPTLEMASNHTGLSGIYWWDSKLANAQCGFSQTPSGYVWHHVEDMKTMILVPQDLHSVAMGGMSHTGGASLIKKFLGLQ